MPTTTLYPAALTLTFLLISGSSGCADTTPAPNPERVGDAPGKVGGGEPNAGSSGTTGGGGAPSPSGGTPSPPATGNPGSGTPKPDAGTPGGGTPAPDAGTPGGGGGGETPGGGNPNDNGTCTGMVGNGVGRVIAAGSIPLVDGGKYDVRNSCGKPVYMLNATEDCGICVDFLGTWSRPGNLFDQLKAAGADVVIISASTPTGGAGSVATAQKLRARFGLGTRFYIGYEPLGADNFGGFVQKRAYTAGARIALLLKRGNVMAAGGQEDEPARIRSLLGL
jgi:hypothetical protein